MRPRCSYPTPFAMQIEGASSPADGMNTGQDSGAARGVLIRSTGSSALRSLDPSAGTLQKCKLHRILTRMLTSSLKTSPRRQPRCIATDRDQCEQQRSVLQTAVQRQKSLVVFSQLRRANHLRDQIPERSSQCRPPKKPVALDCSQMTISIRT